MAGPLFSGLLCAALLAVPTRGAAAPCRRGTPSVRVLNVAAATTTALAGVTVLPHSVTEKRRGDSHQDISPPLAPPTNV